MLGMHLALLLVVLDSKWEGEWEVNMVQTPSCIL